MSNFFDEKKGRSKNPLKPKARSKCFFTDIIPSTGSKILRSGTTLSNFHLIVDVYSKITKLNGMERIATEEVIDKLDMFQSRLGKIDEFGWWDLEAILADAGKQFTPKYIKG